MALDDNLILRGGSSLTALDASEAAPVALTVSADGGYCADIKKTGIHGIWAVAFFPSKPTSYTHTVTLLVQDSEHLAAGWETIATFPIVYAMTMEMFCTATTAFTAAAIGQVIVATTDSGSATGVVLYYDTALETIGGYGKIIIAMADSGDDYSTAGDTLTMGGTGVGAGTQGAIAVLSPPPSGFPGMLAVHFETQKRYVRCYGVPTGGSFGLVTIYLTDHVESIPRLG